MLTTAMGFTDLEVSLTYKGIQFRVTTVVLGFITYLKSRHHEDNVNGPTVAEGIEGGQRLMGEVSTEKHIH